MVWIQIRMDPDLGPNCLQWLLADDKSSPWHGLQEKVSYPKPRRQVRPPDKSVLSKINFLIFLNRNICCGYSKEPFH